MRGLAELLTRIMNCRQAKYDAAFEMEAALS